MNKRESSDSAKAGPPRYRMATVVFIVLWPLVHFLPELTMQLITNPLLAEGATVLTIVLLMTYVILPALSRAARGKAVKTR